MQSSCQDDPCAEPDPRGACDKNRAEKDVEQQNQVSKPADIRSAVLQPERVVIWVQCHPDDRDDADDNGDGPPAADNEHDHGRNKTNECELHRSNDGPRIVPRSTGGMDGPPPVVLRGLSPSALSQSREDGQRGSSTVCPGCITGG
jgi:hypothetical protein